MLYPNFNSFHRSFPFLFLLISLFFYSFLSLLAWILRLSSQLPFSFFFFFFFFLRSPSRAAGFHHLSLDHLVFFIIWRRSTSSSSSILFFLSPHPKIVSKRGVEFLDLIWGWIPCVHFVFDSWFRLFPRSLEVGFWRGVLEGKEKRSGSWDFLGLADFKVRPTNSLWILFLVG